MKIEVWSDFVCPFCYIGKRHMETAIEASGMKDQVEIVYKSFQLNPDSKKHYDQGIDEIIAEKYGISVEQAQTSNNNIVEAAKAVGLDYNFKEIKPTNTFDAHRLSHYAKEEGKMDAFTEAMMRCYFVEAVNISETEVLLGVIEAIGLDRDKAQSILESTKYSDAISDDVEEARKFGVSGVPFFVFDREAAVSGAQPVEHFVEVLSQLSKKNA